MSSQVGDEDDVDFVVVGGSGGIGGGGAVVK